MATQVTREELLSFISEICSDVINLHDKIYEFVSDNMAEILSIKNNKKSN